MSEVPVSIDPLASLRALVDGLGDNGPANVEAWRAWLSTASMKDLARASADDVSALLLRADRPGVSERAEKLRTAIAAARKGITVAPPPKPERVGPSLPDADPEVLLALDIARDGRPRASVRNAVEILTRDPVWVGRLRRNRFGNVLELGDEPLTDDDLTHLAVWMDRTYALTLPSRQIAEAAAYVGSHASYHPVADFLDLCADEWDGIPRVRSLLSEYFGADPDHPLVETFAIRFMVGAVKRIMEPGSKFDTVLILVGAQGARKSSGLKALFGQWFADSDFDPHGKEAHGQIRGVWGYEIAEIEKWNSRRDQMTIKGFLSSSIDRSRMPYARYWETVPRQCVLVGSTNADEFLIDPTGDRRYHPIRLVGGPDSVNVDAIAAHRRLLWGEAVHLYRAGTQVYLTPEERAHLDVTNADFRDLDVWTDLVSQVVVDQQRVTAAWVLERIGVHADKMDDRAKGRVGKVLRSLGWRSVVAHTPGGRESRKSARAWERA